MCRPYKSPPERRLTTQNPTSAAISHHQTPSNPPNSGQTAVRRELARSAETVGISHVTPHHLRHTYATALVNPGVSLQALMALLGHVSADMSLR